VTTRPGASGVPRWSWLEQGGERSAKDGGEDEDGKAFSVEQNPLGNRIGSPTPQLSLDVEDGGFLGRIPCLQTISSVPRRRGENGVMEMC
jgi:hypothetical protein